MTVDDLKPYRVLDLSTGIAGGYLTKLLVDAGADVVKVEPPGGDPLRRRRNPDGSVTDDHALFRYLHAGKRSIVGRLSDPEVEQLLGAADLLVESFAEPIADLDELRRRHPRLVVCSLSPWGRSGPWAHRPGNEFIAQAEGGVIALHGLPDQVPYQIGGRLMEWCAGTIGACGSLAAMQNARVTARGDHVDCSLLAAATLTGTGFNDLIHSLVGRPPITSPARIAEVPSIEPASDGWVGVNTNTRQQFEDFVVLIERPDLIGNDDWPMWGYRMQPHAQWNEMVHAWTRRHTRAEIIERAALLRIPVAPVNDAPSVLSTDHFVERGVFGSSPDGTLQQPRVPYALDGVRPVPRGSAPTLGEHNGEVGWDAREDGSTTGAPRRPLEGVRVLDATAHWAGPAAGQLLAFLGAEVIHLESVERIDGGRTYVGAMASHERWWELSYNWLSVNPGKLDVTLPMNVPQGLELIKALIKECDVMIENFAPRVFDNFGLDHEAVLKINPTIVFARMPAFGLDGPWRDRVGFAQTMEQSSGMAWVTGHPGDQARVPRGPCDPLAGWHAVFAVLVGLERARAQHGGVAIEATMIETALSVAAELTVEYSAYGTQLQRVGNRSRDAAPQGLYAASGVERWLALSVETDEQWQSLCEVTGSAAWAQDAQLAEHIGRVARADELDEGIATWARSQDLDEAIARLVERGVTAGEARDPRLMSEHEQLSAWGFFERLDHPLTGAMAFSTIPMRFASVAQWARWAAPTLGHDNHQVLTEILKISEGEYAAAEQANLVGTEPLHVGKSG